MLTKALRVSLYSGPSLIEACDTDDTGKKLLINKILPSILNQVVKCSKRTTTGNNFEVKFKWLAKFSSEPIIIVSHLKNVAFLSQTDG